MLIYSFKRSYQERKRKVGMNLKLSFLNAKLEAKNYRMRGCLIEATGLDSLLDKSQHGESQGPHQTVT